MIRTMFGLVLAFAVASAALFGTSARADDSDWRERVKVLRIGFVAGSNPRHGLKRIEPFRRRLSLELAIPVEVLPMADTAMLIDAHTSARIDYAIYNASAYAAAEAACRCLEPLVVPKAEDGSTGYHSIIVARSDRKPASLADLKDATLVLSRPGSTAGHLVPFIELQGAGIHVDDYFQSVTFAGAPASAVKTVLLGAADAAIAWSSLSGDPEKGFDRGTLHDLVADGTMTMDEVAIVWRSRLIPHGPHAVRRGLPDALKKLLVAELVRLNELDGAAYDAVERVYGGGFVAADRSMFSLLIDAFRPQREASPAAMPKG
ncbi:MAG: hypothetical protein C0606_06910 [Hyphomicrobiales bacterium]|nr:MAG: hypothetical protein C0606_06910 [Hyphomicrobiales bacterium]